MTNVYAQDGDAGIHLQGQGSDTCLTNGTCSFSPYQTLKIREDLTAEENTAQKVIQDVFLATTFFVGTLATVGLIVSGLMMTFGGASESQFEKGKKGIKYSIVGLLLVLFSYSIIRLVQFIAQGKT